MTVPNVIPNPCTEAATNRNWDAVRRMILNITNGVNPAPGFLIRIDPEDGAAVISVKCSNEGAIGEGWIATYDEGNLLFVPAGGTDPEVETGCQYPFVNYSGETMPAYAVFEVTGIEDGGVKQLKGVKPNSVLARQYAINGDTAVVHGGSGLCSLDKCVPWAMIDDSTIDDEPVIGSPWGPKPDSWKLHRGYPGYMAVGGTLATVDSMQTLVRWIGVDFLVGWTEAAIAAASGTKATGLVFDAGSEVSVWAIDRVGFGDEINEDSGFDITASTTAGAVAAERIVQIKTTNQRYWVDVEKCA